MAFIVNSAPGAGLRFEASQTFDGPKDALEHAVGLSRRGMRAIRIKDIESGVVFDERGLRQHMNELKSKAEHKAE